MLIKNTFKIMFSNVSMIMKSCLYKLLVVSIVLLLGYSVLSPILDEFAKAGLYVGIYDFFARGIFAFNGAETILIFEEIRATFLDVMNSNVAFTWNFVGLFVILAVLLPILLGLSKVAEYDVLFGRLSSNCKLDFLTSYFENFKKGFVFRLFRLIFSIPALIIVFALIYFYSVLLVGEFETIIAIVLMVLSTIVIISLFMTFFLIYEPNLIIKESSPFKALKNSMQNVFKYGFWKVFGILLLMVLSLFIFNAFVAVLTYGFGLLITIPLSMHFSNVLRMVLCYDSLGMDYYLDNKNVCVTKKRYEKNTMEEMKDLM